MRTILPVGLLGAAAGLVVVAVTGNTDRHYDTAQTELRQQIDTVRVPGVPLTSDRPAHTTTPTTPTPASGDPLGLLFIPAIGVDTVIVEGIGTGSLQTGPGHYPQSALPGQPGHIAIAGHRTTFGAPFADLDLLAKGDTITVATPGKLTKYRIDRTVIVAPDDMSVLDDQGDNRLTLTACHPKGSRRLRIVVQATQT